VCYAGKGICFGINNYKRHALKCQQMTVPRTYNTRVMKKLCLSLTFVLGNLLSRLLHM
jgi:hypothetical protein